MLLPSSIDFTINYFYILSSTLVCDLSAPGNLVHMLWPMADLANTTQQALAKFVH